MFCSNPCRSKAYRGRQSEAQRRYAAGEPLDVIAAALGTDVETAAGWVGATKKA